MKNIKINTGIPNLISNDENYMKSLVDNIQMLRIHNGWSVRVLSEKADLSFDTLQNFLKGKAKDCNLSTVVKLARAFNVSIDEIVGAGTIEEETKKVISMARRLKEHHRYTIRWFAKHQYLLHAEVPATSKQISVLLPECNHGHLIATNVTEPLNIDHLAPSVRSEVCLGLRIPCDHYEPFFMADETILLGAHRDGVNGEKCVISKDGNLYICKKKIDFIDGKKNIKYMSLFDGNLLFNFADIDDRLGYVIGFLHPDGTWGAR